LQIGFLTEWQLYAQKLEGDNWAGEKLDKSKLDKLNGMAHGGHWNVLEVLTCHRPPDQQIGQLFELMQAIKNPDSEGENQ
jgi:hypothetical protein